MRFFPKKPKSKAMAPGKMVNYVHLKDGRLFLHSILSSYPTRFNLYKDRSLKTWLMFFWCFSVVKWFRSCASYLLAVKVKSEKIWESKIW